VEEEKRYHHKAFGNFGDNYTALLDRYTRAVAHASVNRERNLLRRGNVNESIEGRCTFRRSR
jgi:hypothetical protein